MDKKTVNSYWPDLKELQAIEPKVSAHLSELGIRTPKELLAQTESKEKRRNLAHNLQVPESELAGWIRLAELSELKGMGTLNANLLSNAGVEEISKLALCNPAVLHKKLLVLHNQSKNRPFPREAIIRVWIRAAQERSNN